MKTNSNNTNTGHGKSNTLWPVINPFFVEDLVGGKERALTVIKSVRDSIKKKPRHSIGLGYIVEGNFLFDVVKDADGKYALMCSGIAGIVKDLLSEDHYWTFWKSDWSDKRHIFWGGKTKFKAIVKKMKEELGEKILWERQVQLKTPQFKFD